MRWSAARTSDRTGTEKGPRRAERQSRLDRQMSELFDRLFAPFHPLRPSRADALWHPFTDVYESETEFIVRMELAGIDPSSLEVAREGRCLKVRGVRPDPMRGRAVACHQLEISQGPFERVLCLPEDFREEDVRPEYDSRSGFLLITVSKTVHED